MVSRTILPNILTLVFAPYLHFQIENHTYITREYVIYGKWVRARPTSAAWYEGVHHGAANPLPASSQLDVVHVDAHILWSQPIIALNSCHVVPFYSSFHLLQRNRSVILPCPLSFGVKKPLIPPPYEFLHLNCKNLCNPKIYLKFYFFFWLWMLLIKLFLDFLFDFFIQFLII